MAHSHTAFLISPIREIAHPVEGSSTDYDPLMDLIGDSRLVLLGEASHGTHDFYRERAEITKRLITEKGFTGVADHGRVTDDDREVDRKSLFHRRDERMHVIEEGVLALYLPVPVA
jgi:erythromycin esterase-like protein